MNDTTTNDNNNNNDNEQQQHDNSATLPRSNISSPQHSAKPNQQQSALSQNNTNTNNNSTVGGEGKATPAVVELSSLFQTESTLFRDESQHSSGKFLCKIAFLQICIVSTMICNLLTKNSISFLGLIFL